MSFLLMNLKMFSHQQVTILSLQIYYAKAPLILWSANYYNSQATRGVFPLWILASAEAIPMTLIKFPSGHIKFQTTHYQGR